LQIHYSPYLSSHSNKLYSLIWNSLNARPTMCPSLNSLVQIGIKGASVTNFLPAGCVSCCCYCTSLSIPCLFGTKGVPVLELPIVQFRKKVAGTCLTPARFASQTWIYMTCTNIHIQLGFPYHVYNVPISGRPTCRVVIHKIED